MSVRIAASMLAADVLRLGDEAARVEAGGVDLLHVDVMDGRFVPNLGLGPDVAAALARRGRTPIDVHLMIRDPDRYLEIFAKAGATMISVHAEAATHLHRTLARIRELGVKAGVALNPATGVAAIDDVIDLVDHVLVMSVDPGFSGQTFIPHAIEKVAAARARLVAAGRAADVEVDGGVDASHAGALSAAGASILVAGAAIFAAADPAAAVRRLAEAAARAAR